jgi:5-methylcytosine-specific restriction endonuclease McrA
MSEHIPAALSKRVRQRAGLVCEYCRLPQASQEAAFHIDHIQPRAAQGLTTADNLALACVTCSLKKAARTQVRDPRSKRLVPLFHPRHDRWSDHFRWSSGCRIIGRTATGRATIQAPRMIRRAVIGIRKALVKLGLLLIEE